jgi:DNA-binding NtrC family response regulator
MNDGKGRILVIDDDEGIRKVITTALKEEGYSTDTASSGKEAIEKSNLNFYNLALIDIRLPDMVGTMLLTSLKETTPPMRKIILTGYPAAQNAIDAVNNGANGYLVKPLKIDQLLQTVERELARQRESVQYDQEKVALFVETRVKELEERKASTSAGTD